MLNGVLRFTVSNVLQPGLVDDLVAQHLRVADLDRVFRFVVVIALRRKRELTGAAVLLAVVEVLVSQRERVSLPELKIESRAQVGPGARIGHRQAARRRIWHVSRVVDCVRIAGRARPVQDRGHDAVVLNVPTVEVEEERGFLTQSRTYVSVVLQRVIRGDLPRKGILRIEDVRVPVHKKLAVQLVRTRLGEDLDAAETKLVVLGGKGILIDTNLADGRLGRQLTGGKSVDVDLPTVGTRGWSCERRQFRRQLIWIVGERVEILVFDDQRIGIRARIEADGRCLIRHRHLLLLHFNG